MNDDLGDRMKDLEMREAGRSCLPLLPVMARLDGKCFHRFTKDLKRPFDKVFHECMCSTARRLLEETQALCAYTQSDEISLCWYSRDRRSQIWFDGRIQKMVSVLAAMASVRFGYAARKHLKGHGQAKAKAMPVFDCRVWTVPTKDEAANTFLWRELDASKNSISMAARHYFSHKQLMNNSGAEMQEMMFQQKGVNWNSYPTAFKRGTWIAPYTEYKKFTAEDLEALPPKHAARTNPDLVMERRGYKQLRMPPFMKVVNRVGVIFEGEEPQLYDSPTNLATY